MNTDILRPLLASVREFSKANVRALEIDREKVIPAHVFRGLAELGLFGVTLPVAYGGAGLSARDATQVVATLAEADRSVATTVGLHLGLGTRALVAWGTPAQQARWLPPLASGEQLAAFATTEPDAGSDLSQLRTLAALQPDGSLQLSGTKIFVTNGAYASVLTLTASTPGLGGAQHGQSLLVLDPKTRGVERQPEEHKLGLRGSSTTAFILDDVALDASHVLGEPGQGARQLAHVLSWGRLLLSAGCTGAAKTALSMALSHVHLRRQFRKLLVQQEVVQQQLARAAAIHFGMVSLVRAAAEAEHDWDTLSRLTTSAKVFCSEGAFELADLAVQLHGGSGYIEDTGLAILLRDARVTRIFEGANDVLLTHQGLVELTQPRPAGAPEVLCDSVAHRRQKLSELGVRALEKKAAQHALGRAVTWRDAATAARAFASTPVEHAAAELLCDEALRVATAAPLPAIPAGVLTRSILEGHLP